jgi:hypothetical protein
MNKVIYIPATFCAEGHYSKVKVPTGKTEPGLFGFEREVTREEQRFVETGRSDCDIDGQQLASDLACAVAKLNAQGYEVVTVTPVASGNHVSEAQYGLVGELRAGMGYGYSFTKGLIVVARQCSR